MAKGSGLAQGFWAGGYDLGGDVGSVQRCACPRSQLEVTGINQSAIHRVNGPADGLIEFNTWFNDAAGQEHAGLKGLPTADVLVLYANRSTRGASAAALTAKQVNYDWSRGQDGSLQGTILAQGQGFALEWGEMVTPGTVVQVAAAAETGIVSAISSNGAVGYGQVMAQSLNGSLTIEHSSDTTNGIDGVWATLLTLVATMVARTAYRVTVTGTVNKGLRARSAGGYGTFAVALRRGTAQDDTAL